MARTPSLAELLTIAEVTPRTDTDRGFSYVVYDSDASQAGPAPSTPDSYSALIQTVVNGVIRTRLPLTAHGTLPQVVANRMLHFVRGTGDSYTINAAMDSVMPAALHTDFEAEYYDSLEQVRGFIRDVKEQAFDLSRANGSGACASSRTWEYAARLMAAARIYGVTDDALLAASVGDGRARDFSAWRQRHITGGGHNTPGL